MEAEWELRIVGDDPFFSLEILIFFSIRTCVVSSEWSGILKTCRAKMDFKLRLHMVLTVRMSLKPIRSSLIVWIVW